MPYALPEDSFLHSKNSPQNRRRYRHGRSPSRTGYSCSSSSFPWCAPFPLPGSDLVVCDFSTFNGKSKWSFCTKFSPYAPVSLSYPPPPREYRPAPCGESTQTQRSPLRRLFTNRLRAVRSSNRQKPQGSDKMVEKTVGFCLASMGGCSVLRRTKRTVYTCSVILKSIQYITLMFKLDNGILGTRKG